MNLLANLICPSSKINTFLVIINNHQHLTKLTNDSAWVTTEYTHMMCSSDLYSTPTHDNDLYNMLVSM